MTRPLRLVPLIALCALSLPAVAQWQENGLVLPTTGQGTDPAAAGDGAGGMIVAWMNTIADVDIVAQRVDDRGRLLWGATGVVVADPGVSSHQTVPAVAADGHGGAYVAWLDTRLPTLTTVYAQHLSADGTASYAANGLALVTGSNFTTGAPIVAPTADGGALVAWWLDLGATVQVRVQKLTPAGAAWSYGGVVVASGTFDVEQLGVAEFSGGRIAVCYTVDDAVEGLETWAAVLGGEGAIYYGPNLAFDTSDEEELAGVLADDRGGVYIGAVCRGSTPAIRLTYMDWDGDFDTPFGAQVAATTETYVVAQLASAPDGVWVAWNDGPDVRVQRMTPGLLPLLQSGGVLVASSANASYDLLAATADLDGGCLLVWEEMAAHGYADFMAQKLDSAGQPLWDPAGVSLRSHLDTSLNPTLLPDGAGGLLATWGEYTEYGADAFVQRIERSGHWGYPAPEVASVADMPDDQGGEVLVSWDASRLDSWSDVEVSHYTLWRALPESALAGLRPAVDWLDAAANPAGAKAVAAPLVRTETSAVAAVYWLLLGTFDAYQQPGYAALAATHADSTAADPADQLFQVLAHGIQAGAWWASEPATGRSVDNLAPAMPTHLTGEAGYQPHGMDLSWSPVLAPDLSRYLIHRGPSPNFIPGRITFLDSVTDTTFFDAGWSLDIDWHYKIAAVDVHGNASGYAALSPLAVSAAGSVQAVSTALLPNHPNPFNPSTTIRYELAAAGPVRLRVYDAAGRLVRTLVDGHQPQGRREARWDGRDGAGRASASGVYLCRLEAAGRVQSRCMTLLK